MTSSLPNSPTTFRNGLVALLNASIEVIVWAIIVVSPWLVGGYLPQHVFLMILGLCVAMLFWSLTQVLKWRLTLYACWVSFFFVALFITSGLGVIPSSRETLRALSPTTAQLYDDLLPSTREVPMDGPIDEQLPFSPGS